MHADRGDYAGSGLCLFPSTAGPGRIHFQDRGRHLEQTIRPPERAIADEFADRQVERSSQARPVSGVVTV